MTSTHLFLFCLTLVGLGLSNSCNQYKTKPMSHQDSVNIQIAVRQDNMERQIDSLARWVYEVEKDGRNAERLALKDNQLLVAKIDSFIRANPKESKFARFFGTLIGEVAKRTVPGL